MRRTPYRSADCGSCYGNGCTYCGGTGSVSTQEDIDAFEDAMERRAEADREERMIERGDDD